MFIDQLFKNPTLYFSILFVVIGSIVLHELGHGLVATWQGDPTPRMRGRLTWNPVVHMGWFSMGLAAVVGIAWGMMPVNPAAFRNRRWGHTMVAFAGPAVNLTLAFLSALLVTVSQVLDAPGVIVQFWAVGVTLNVLLFLFNLIPVPPLDGFTVLTHSLNLGAFGDLVRRAGMFPLIVAILIVNSAPFDLAVATMTDFLLLFWALVFYPFVGGAV